MGHTLLVIRIFFFLVMLGGGHLLTLVVADWDERRGLVYFISGSIGGLVILVDIFLKGFSLRGLTALTFGLFVGFLASLFLTSSPLFAEGDPEVIFIARMGTFVILMYLGAVISLRGKDEFNLVIPYMRFVPHEVNTPLAVVDTSALIDGRLVGICESKFMAYGLVIPSFIVDELQRIADSSDPVRQAKGRRGLEAMNKLKRMSHIDLRIHQSDLDRRQRVEAKLIYLAQSMKAKILTTDYNLAQIGEFHAVEWLNINSLVKALNTELVVGEQLEVTLVKAGKEAGQAVGFLGDGSMVVVNEGRRSIGQTVVAEVQSILPSGGGKLIFAKLLQVLRSSPEVKEE